MIIKVDVNITAPELAQSINRLAEALPNLSSIGEVSTEPAEVAATEPPVEEKPKKSSKGKKSSKATTDTEVSSTTKESSPATEEPVPEAPKGKQITLEDVRAKLAALSQDGKQAEVKALITEFGAKKLSDIPADKYSELLAKAEVL